MTPYYQDESVTIYHGDCREILPHLGPVDHGIMDPPYGEHVHSKQWVSHALTGGRSRFGGKGAHKELGFKSLTSELRGEIARQCERLVKRWSLIFSDVEGASLWATQLSISGLEPVRTCIWIKPDAAPQFTGDRPGSGCEAIVTAHRAGRKRWNGGGRHGVFTHCVNSFGRLDRPHPSVKPDALMNELVTLFTDPGDLIADFFMGSGATLVAAKRLGRKAIGIEIEEKYCEIAAKRLSQGALTEMFL